MGQGVTFEFREELGQRATFGFPDGKRRSPDLKQFANETLIGIIGLSGGNISPASVNVSSNSPRPLKHLLLVTFFVGSNNPSTGLSSGL